jgi:hypothetical protein
MVLTLAEIEHKLKLKKEELERSGVERLRFKLCNTQCQILATDSGLAFGYRPPLMRGYFTETFDGLVGHLNRFQF